EQPPQLVLGGENPAADAVEDVRPLLDRARSPRREGALRGGDGAGRLLGVRLRVLADHVGEVGGIAVRGRGRAARPFAGDVVVEGLHASSAGNLHSIKSAASSCSEPGILTPIALAVFSLIVSSNREGCSTGRCAGVWPRGSY